MLPPGDVAHGGDAAVTTAGQAARVGYDPVPELEARALQPPTVRHDAAADHHHVGVEGGAISEGPPGPRFVPVEPRHAGAQPDVDPGAPVLRESGGARKRGDER